MSKEALEQRLTELHDELASATHLDPELRGLLRDVADDIETLLAEQPTGAGGASSDDVRNRIRQATVEFEAEHPHVAHILGDLADALTKLGI